MTDANHAGLGPLFDPNWDISSLSYGLFAPRDSSALSPVVP